jgi:uncharacterized protein YuzE
MRFLYDAEADALEVRLEDAAIARTEQLDEGTLVDFDIRGGIVAIEIIQPARRWPLDAVINQLSDSDANLLRSFWDESERFPFERLDREEAALA